MFKDLNSHDKLIKKKLTFYIFNFNIFIILAYM